MTDRLARLKLVLWTLVGVLAAVTAVRFRLGLGAVTNLSDATPWGLWIGFDVMSGVALAAGGFVLAATVYIFGLERFRPFVRPAILTAWLGYAAVAVGLLYDLGLPWRIWHPLVHWQYHSVLFEVAACVMLYLTVLTLEFAPAVLEHPRFRGPVPRGILRFLKKATIPLVITGIVLSTLHQSSLGSLFLITPYRLHPLWYSHIIYVLFFVSAVALGLMMVVLESLATAWFMRHEVHRKEIGDLGRAASVVLWLYLALRLGDLALGGELGLAFDGSARGTLFLFEIGLSALLPATLMLFRRVRENMRWMALAAGCTVLGMIFYRLDVSILAFARPEGFGYFPSWEEFAVSVGIVAAFALIFIGFVEHLRVYDDVGRQARVRRPSFDPATPHRLLPASLAAPGRFTAAALAGLTLALFFLPLGGRPPVRTPTRSARWVEGRVLREPGSVRPVHLVVDAAGHGVAPADSATLVLLIDGNRDGDAVLFDHDAHEARLGGAASCALCHHLDPPLDRAGSCVECHRDMYDSTAVFDHESHVRATDGNAGCIECHADSVDVKSYETATACVACHATPTADDPVLDPPHERWRAAAGYMDAMHGLCRTCHLRAVEREPDRYPAGLERCANCHDPDLAARLHRLAPARERAAASSAVAAGTATGTSREGG
ncbi:MAG: Ni/Fe-hydrogenase cytochrome b subunit [Gemmatimonadota bacterium]|jgi:Ni/Fe-hydrogenase subunit HybB-like protein